MQKTEAQWAEEVQALRQALEARSQELAALAASEQRYRSLFEHASDAIFIWGAEGRLAQVNARACELTGYSAADLSRMRATDLFTGTSRNRMSLVWPAPGSNRVATIERELRRADGSTFLADVHVRRIDAETVQAIVRDVTERRQMEEALHRYAERLVSLHRLDQVILSVQSSHEVAEAAIENLRQFVPSDRISVLVFDPATGGTELLAVSLDGAPEPGPGLALPGSSAMTEGLRRREIDVVRDLRTLAGEPAVDALLAAGYRSMLNVPLVSQEQVIGVLNLAGRDPDAFAVEHIDVARETAVVLSLAVQSARLFEEVLAGRERQEQLSRRLVRIQEEERRRLALELHDEIGQVLTALHLSLDLDDPALTGPARDKLDKARKIVEVLTAQVRNLSLDLRPTLLDDLGLLPALLWYVKRYTEQTGLQVAFQHAGLGHRRFPAEVETAAYRIVQEALTNVARHAGVVEVGVQAWVKQDHLFLQVEDNGRGFALMDDRTVSSGLSGMRERARLVGGDLTITTAPGEGVQIQARLPMNGRA